jgi:hypothetical protein
MPNAQCPMRECSLYFEGLTSVRYDLSTFSSVGPFYRMRSFYCILRLLWIGFCLSSLSTFTVAEEINSLIRSVEVTRDIEKNGQQISFDIGKHFPGVKVKASLHLKNTTDRKLDLLLKPSCNCTELSVSTLRIAAGGTQTIQFDMKTPASGVTTAYIKCSDESAAFESSIGLRLEALEAVKLENDRLAVNSKIDTVSQIVVVPATGHCAICEIELESGSRWGIQSISLAEGSWRLGLRRNEIVEKEYYDEYLRFKVRVQDSEGVSASIPLVSRVLYSDRFRLGPSFVTPKTDGNRIRFLIFASGENVEKTQSEASLLLTATSGGVSSKVTIEKTRVRNGSLLFEAAMEADVFWQIVKQVKDGSLTLELSLGDMTSSTEVKVDTAKEPI